MSNDEPPLHHFPSVQGMHQTAQPEAADPWELFLWPLLGLVGSCSATTRRTAAGQHDKQLQRTGTGGREVMQNVRAPVSADART